jgi:hypothetical protein
MVGVSKIDGPYLARIIAEAAANGTFVEIDFDGVVNGAKKPKKIKSSFCFCCRLGRWNDRCKSCPFDAKTCFYIVSCGYFDFPLILREKRPKGPFPDTESNSGKKFTNI